MNPFAILRSWFQDPEFRLVVAYSTGAAIILLAVVVGLNARSH